MYYGPNLFMFTFSENYIFSIISLTSHPPTGDGHVQGWPGAGAGGTWPWQYPEVWPGGLTGGQSGGPPSWPPGWGWRWSRGGAWVVASCLAGSTGHLVMST